MNYYFWIWSIFLPLWLNGQSISIQVTSEETGESLYNAHAWNHHTKTGKVSDETGRIHLKAKPGDSLSISYVGYQDTSFIVKTGVHIYNIALEIEPMQEVVVFAEEPFNRKAAEGQQEVPMELLESLPAFNGDPDIIKAITFLPGVTGGKEGYSHLSVRGGDIDENLILLDGAPLYNINHFGGFVSMFHSEMIRSVNLYKGYKPSRFGGRLSSVLDIQPRSGNYKEHIFQADISPLSTKAHLSGPIWKGKVSYIIGGRRTFIDLILLRHLAKATRSGKRRGEAPLFTFYDVNGKITARISDNQNLSFSTFRGSDQFFYINNERYNKEDNQYNILNQNYALNYSYYPLSSTTLKAHFSSSFYQHYFEDQRTRLADNENEIPEEKEFYYNHTGNTIRTYKAQVYGNTQLFRDWEMNYGVDHEILKYSIYLDRFQNQWDPDNFIANDSISITTDLKTAHVSSFFTDGLYRLNARMAIKAGLRLAHYRQDDYKTWMYEPGVLISYDLSSNTTINASYNRQQQFSHLLGYTVLEGNFREFYMVADNEIPPSGSHQWTAGMFYHFKNSTTWLQNANFSLEIFHKRQNHLNKFLPGVDPNKSVVEYQDHLLKGGEAHTYGLESAFEKTAGKFHGSLAYTYAHSIIRFDGFNHGKSFNADFDSRHDFDILLIYKFRKGYQLSTRWNYRTGRPFTLQTSQTGQDIITGNYPVITSINESRYPPYHRLDLSLDRKWRTRKKGIKNWFGISIYNAYNRVNPYYAYPSDDGKELNVNGMFPLIPSFHFGFELGGGKTKNDDLYRK